MYPSGHWESMIRQCLPASRAVRSVRAGGSDAAAGAGAGEGASPATAADAADVTDFDCLLFAFGGGARAIDVLIPFVVRIVVTGPVTCQPGFFSCAVVDNSLGEQICHPGTKYDVQEDFSTGGCVKPGRLLEERAATSAATATPHGAATGAMGPLGQGCQTAHRRSFLAAALIGIVVVRAV